MTCSQMSAAAPKDFEQLYAALTGRTPLDAVHQAEKARISQLAQGLQLFARPDAGAAAKFKRHEAVQLADGAQSVSLGKAASAWEQVSQLLQLHEAQTALLLRRWLKANAPGATNKWQPSAEQTRAICQAYFSQRWHLLLSLRHIIDVSLLSDHPDQPAAQAILEELDATTLLKSLLQTAAGTLVATGSAIVTGANAAHSATYSALQLRDESHRIVWREQAHCELCCLLLCILGLRETAQPDSGALCSFAHALLQHVLMVDSEVLQDRSGMRALAARLGTAVVLNAVSAEYDPAVSLHASVPMYDSQSACS